MNILDKKKKDVEEKMEKLSPDITHSLQVCRLALMIFNDLKHIHKLGEQGKFLLISASLLHDIGISKSFIKHHKISEKMINKIPFKFLNSREVKIIGNISRYHRKALPKETHKIYNSMNARDKNIIRKISAILRIADGLDRAHFSNVENIKMENKNSKLTLIIKWKNQPSNVDLSGLDRKKKLFEQEFGNLLLINK
jgi:exopolyphosphatase/guanosine-5'-triphosphate,3'-diphosphate pyrophosphatase